jgi:hypothetical protein
VGASALLACGGRTGIDPPGRASERADAHVSGDDGGGDAGEEASFDAFDDAGDDADDAADAEPDAPFDAPPSDAGVACPDGGVPTAYLLGESGGIFTFDPATLTTHKLGRPSCPTAVGPFTLSVSREGKAYVLYSNWTIYEVDLTTLACHETPFQMGQLGLDSELGIAVSRASGTEELLISGVPTGSNVPILAQGSLSSFVLTSSVDIAGSVPVSASLFPIDTQADLTGHVFALSDGGQVLEIDIASGAVLQRGQVPVRPSQSWAIMTYQAQVFVFNGSEVFRYDPATQASELVGDVGITVIGASAVPCGATD